MATFSKPPKVGIEKMAEVVRYAGGELVGRTRLQKIFYLLTATGLDDTFRFSYKHYGPYSEYLADVADLAVLTEKVSERRERASWGGLYSVYSVDGSASTSCNKMQDSNKRDIILKTAATNAVVLELAATAVFLSKNGFDDPWAEVARRKPVKYNAARYKSAQVLLKKLKDIEVPHKLPDNVVA